MRPHSQFPSLFEVMSGSPAQLENWYVHLPRPSTSGEEAILAEIIGRLKQEFTGPEEEEAAAYHQAGHAVIAILFGFRVTSVSILNKANEHCTFLVQEPRTQDTAEGEIVIHLSGMAAQFRKDRKSSRRWHAVYDNREANLLLADFNLGSALLQEAAIEVVTKHWMLVERVASALVRSKHLDEIELRKLVFGIPQGPTHV